MKKQILIVAMMVISSAIQAQEPPKHKGPPGMEERLKRTKEVMQKEVQPSVVQLQAMESTFKTFFTAADKLRRYNPPSPPPPTDPKVKAAMNKLVQERDESIKKILTADQFTKYKTAAKKMQPHRPGEDGPPPRN